eukprot:14583738-Ditylum_brightwellii.AAC.1
MVNGDGQAWSFDAKKQTNYIARRLEKWRYNGKPLEQPRDIFNSNIDYTLDTYTDVIRLNKKLVEVGSKISEYLSKWQKTQDILRTFISNMYCMQEAIKDLSDLTKGLHDSISSNSELYEALEEMAASFSKIQKILPTATFALNAKHNTGKKDSQMEKKMKSIDNPDKL